LDKKPKFVSQKYFILATPPSPTGFVNSCFFQFESISHGSIPSHFESKSHGYFSQFESISHCSILSQFERSGLRVNLTATFPSLRVYLMAPFFHNHNLRVNLTATFPSLRVSHGSILSQFERSGLRVNLTATFPSLRVYLMAPFFHNHSLIVNLTATFPSLRAPFFRSL